MVDVMQQADEPACIRQYDRDRKVLKCKTVLCVKQFAVGVPVPLLSDIPSLDVEKRREILVSALSPSISRLKSELLLEFSVEVQMLILTIVYWVLHSKPKVSIVQVKALIVCCFCLGELDEFIREPQLSFTETGQVFPDDPTLVLNRRKNCGHREIKRRNYQYQNLSAAALFMRSTNQQCDNI